MFPEGKKAKTKKPRKSVDEDAEPLPEPVDVLVDTIIGFLEKSTAYMRTVGNQVFALLSSSVQESTIDLIISVRLYCYTLTHADALHSNWNDVILQNLQKMTRRTVTMKWTTGKRMKMKSLTKKMKSEEKSLGAIATTRKRTKSFGARSRRHFVLTASRLLPVTQTKRMMN